MRQYEKVLIVDNLGLSPLSDHQRHDLLEVIEDPQGLCSTIVAGQLPVENWHDSIGDPTIADAILDRLVHNAHQINLKGTSMRKNRSRLPPGSGAGNQ
jgi:DNA replication protein DnaC